jgi:hypothetical protein
MAALMTTVAASPAAAGQAHVDGAGKLRQATPAEVKAVADAVRALFARSAVSAQVTEHADGSSSAKIGPEALNVWVATINADGSIKQTCVEGTNAATAVQGAPALEVK